MSKVISNEDLLGEILQVRADVLETQKYVLKMYTVLLESLLVGPPSTETTEAEESDSRVRGSR